MRTLLLVVLIGVMASPALGRDRDADAPGPPANAMTIAGRPTTGPAPLLGAGLPALLIAVGAYGFIRVRSRKGG